MSLHTATARAASRRGRRTPRAALALLVAAVVAGCGDMPISAGDVADRKVRVTTTTTWHSDLARRIGGDRVKVTGLIGPGVDPHRHGATAADVRTLARSDIAIRNGLELEAAMSDLFTRIGERVPVVTVGDGVALVDRIEIGDGPEFDPHIWFDPGTWKQAAMAVADAFEQLDPQHAAGYRERLEDFRAELDSVDRQVAALLAPVAKQRRVLATPHDAFTYFADAYGFQTAPVQGTSTVGAATSGDVERVAQTVVEKRLPAVFAESSVPRRSIRAVLAAAAGRGQRARLGGELFGDSLGPRGSPGGTYAGAVLHDARLIAKALAG